MNYKIKITILKKLFHKDLIESYADNPSVWTACQKFKEGEVFLVDEMEPWEMPDGFCGWAWADMQKMIWSMSRGGPRRFVTCCTDGYRPVIFKLERVD
ncbi:MAG: TIGR04076 family protein [Deltaproteobacteria bacterium]|nr:TIGR04076 family protein [Deltaproteobacteria bacterium]